MKTIIALLIVLILIGIGGYVYTRSLSDNGTDTDREILVSDTTDGSDQEMNDTGEAPQGNLDEERSADEQEPTSVLGTTVNDRDITAYHFGTGDTELLFVGGIHGGYSWNTVLVAYELIDYLEANPTAVPESITVTVIPVLNPDGLNAVVGTEGRFDASDVPSTPAERIAGRYNGNTVDLNRNFDCDWQAQGTWQSRSVSGGSAAFSEPESQALKAYVEKATPSAVVVWYSAAGGVYASNCHNGVLPETSTILDVYAQASGYPAFEEFNYYEVTGDMVNWLASENIPGISVLLSTHEAVEWEKNKQGIDALIAHYAE